MDADKDIIKLNKKKDKVWSKLSPLIDNYNHNYINDMFNLIFT